MDRQYSRRSPAVKRLMKEAQELSKPTEQCFAQPLEDNLFEWHFTVRGPPDSDFQGGVYHGRITLPPDYPMKPPSIMLLTPTGRFEVNTKICLSISGHHPETWQPSWSIRTVMLAIIGFMPTKGEGAIGSLDYTPEERKLLAKRSQEWMCPACKLANKAILPKETSTEKSRETQREAAEIASQISFKKEDDKKSDGNASSNPSPASASAQSATNPSTSPANPSTSPANPSTTNPYAAFNQQAAAMGMQFQQPMFQYPQNFPNQPTVPSSQVTNQPSQSENSSTAANQSQSTTPQVVNNNELRQRVTSQGANQTTQPQTDPQRNPRGNQDNSGGRWALVLMVFLTIIMVLLLCRRLYITYEYKFQTGDL
ncbi:uncharacterized protein [Asterias amurensis]|uniref:uncharacterized protein n=1 Tax=Asterias amurensis TaxID=7602 RepID=UPI003AB8E14F